MNEEGGTVRYHRADYLGDVSYPWEVWFDGGQGPIFFTAEQGEAMGLTPPAPQSKAFSVVLDELVVVDPHDDITREQVADSIVGMLEVAGLLRDARQAPQPASEPNLSPPFVTPESERAFQPAPADSDTPDFDAMPVGTVIGDKWGDLLLRRDGGWFDGDDDCFLTAGDGPYTVVYRPAPVSPAEGLRAVLAGLDDVDELLRRCANGNMPDALWLAVGDAARSGGAT